MPVDFTGIYEKLKRADENVLNLKREIDAFIQNGKYPVLPKLDDKLWQEAVDYHRSKMIPLRFAVLAGETIHHLRSILDHIIWQFSSEDTRRNCAGFIEFPICKSEPRSEREVARYDGKIQGISNRKVRRLIGDLQPYHAGDNAADHFLSIVHDMDRFDKHRELNIVDSSALMNFTIPATLHSLAEKVRLHQQGKLPKSDSGFLRYALENYAEVTPQVSFRQFGKRKDQPVVPALEQLNGLTRGVVERFEKHIRRG